MVQTYKLYINVIFLLEHKPPKGQFTKTPRNKHGDSIFQFKCDEDACLYEYRLWKMKNGKFDKFIRQWTVTTYINIIVIL